MLGGIGLNKAALNAASSTPFVPIIGLGTLISIEQTILGVAPNRSGFSLNARRLNRDVLNGFAEPIPPKGTGTIISIEQTVVEPNSGTLIAIEQTIAMASSGNLIRIEQEVIFILEAGGTLISIEQTVASIGSGNLIRLEQRVKNSTPTIPSHLDRFGWDVFLLVGGAQVPCETGMINIQRSEGGASLMDVTFMPGVNSGVQDIEGYAGLPVTLDIETKDGNFRAFTGIVDIGEVDIIQKSITLRCTDRRSELINTPLGAAVTAQIGYYSTVIFQPAKDTFDELTNRLTTVPLTVDFDAYGIINVQNINPKAVADFTLTGIPKSVSGNEDGIFYREPKVEYTSRARITNKVNIKFSYRFPRLWQVERRFHWHTTATICDVLQRGYTMARRDMIEQSARGGGWPLHGNVVFTDITPSGWYCGSMWSTIHLTGTTENAFTPDVPPNPDGTGGSKGTQIFDTVTDTAGVSKQVPRTTTRITGGTNIGMLLADGADWVAAKRWVQTVTENYTLTLLAPQSISQYGEIETFSQYSHEDYTANAGTFVDVTTGLYKPWDDFTVWDNPFGLGTDHESQNYHADVTLGRGLANSAIMTAIAIGKTTILKSHRDTRVTVLRTLWPQIDLKHTVAINATLAIGGGLQAKGKVYTIEHSLNILTGEAFTKLVLALSRSRGDATTTPLVIPPIIPNTDTPDDSDIILGNHFGEDPNAFDPATGKTMSASWTGYVGNKIVAKFGFVPSRSTYPLAFINHTPDIDDSFRIARELYNDAGAGTFDIAIPNDTLVVTF